MGRNGSGKSTLIWTLQGSGRRRSGSVAVRGLRPGRDSTRPAAAPSSGWSRRRPSDLLYLETVGRGVRAADAAAPAAARPRPAGRLAPGIDPRHHPRDLSEGQRLALVLAIVLSTSPRVLLLDEPTRGLDYAAKRQLAPIVRDLAGDGHGVAGRDPRRRVRRRVADHVVVLADGEVVVDRPGTRQVVAASPSYAPQVTQDPRPALAARRRGRGARWSSA